MNAVTSHRHRRRPAVSVVAWLCGLAQLSSQHLIAQSQPQVTFRSSTDLVEVHVVVTDRAGRPVRGLTPADFRILDDDRPQKIVTFSAVEMAVPGVSDDKSPARSMVSAAGSNTASQERRAYVIVLDAFHVDASRSNSVRRLASEFVNNNLGPEDVAAVVLLGASAASGQPFTSDKARLTRAIDQFIGQKSRSATLNTADDASLKAQTGGKGLEMAAEDAEAGARASQAKVMLATLRQICDSLGATSLHRRSIVLFSEGVDFDFTDMIGEDKRPGAGGRGLVHETSRFAAGVLDEWQAAMEAARQASVAVFTVEPRGNTMGNEDIMNARDERDPLTGGKLAPATMGLMAEARRGQGSLRTIASETGGAAVVGTDNFAAGFDGIVRANSAYYVLGYSPGAAPDGAHHRISVSVPSRNDVTISARNGYFAAPPRPVGAAATPTPAGETSAPKGVSAGMRQLLASPLPVMNGLALRGSVAAIRPVGSRTLMSLVLEIDTSDLPFAETADQLSNEIEVAFVAIDASGRQEAGSRSAGQLRVPAAARAAVTAGLRFVAEFEAPPGRYEVRAGVQEHVGGRGGTVILAIDTPALSKAPLAIGAPLFKAVDQMPTSGAFPIIQSVLGGAPTAARVFSSSGALSILVHVSGSDTRSSGVTLTARARDRSGREVFSQSVDLPDSARLRGELGFAHIFSVPLSGLSPGTFDLLFDARSAAGRTASQSATFDIR